MTTKELADTAGVSVDTIQRKAKELFPGKFTQGSKPRYTQKEAIAIIGNVKKTGFIELPQIAEVPTQGADVSRMDRLESLMEKMMTMMTVIMGNQVVQKKSEPAQIEAPPLELREQLRKIVNDASRESGDYQGAWNMLYSEIYYRLHINVSVRASNLHISKLDVLEKENMLMSAILIAREIFGA